MSDKNHDYNANSLNDLLASQFGQVDKRCEESVTTGSKILDDRQKKCDKSDKASRDKVMNNPESQVQYPEYCSSQEDGREILPQQEKDDNGPSGIEYSKSPNLFQDITGLVSTSSTIDQKKRTKNLSGLKVDAPSLGKRSPEEHLSEQLELQKVQKVDSSIKIEIDSLQRLEFDAETTPLQCQETLEIVKLKDSVGISNSRAKREVKKNTQFDNSEYIIDNDEPLDNPARESGASTRGKRQSSSSAAPQKQAGIQNLKYMKISDSQDPFAIMYKHVMEPIIHFDRLEVLFADKQEYEIFIKAKDLKHHNVKPERKEEMLQQRVHLESEGDKMIIVCDINPNFEKHIDSRAESSSRPDEENESPDKIEDMIPSSEQEDLVSPSVESPEPEDFKKPLAKRNGKKRRVGSFQQKKSHSQKSYQTCLPNSIRECSWLSNTEFNINLLNLTNIRIKEEREKKKLDEKVIQEQEMKRLMEDETKRVHFVNINQDSPMESGEIPPTQKTEENTEMKDNGDIKKVEQENTPFEQVPSSPVLPQPAPEPVKEPEFEYILPKDLKSIDQVCWKFKNGYYHSLDKLLSDLTFLVQNTIELRCKNTLSKIYLSNFLMHASKIIKEKKKEFLDKWRTYYNIRLSNNQINNCIVGQGDPKVWYKKFDQSTKREYHEIKDYKIKIPGETEPMNDQVQNETQLTNKQIKERDRVKEIMKTEKKSKCTGDCCNDQDQLQKPKTGNMHMSDVFKQSKCECIQKKTECGPECGCDPEKCRNRQMSLKQSLKFGIDVQERVTWGIDICTAVNFLTICPRDLPRQVQSNFVEKKLIYAIQQQDEQGYDVLRALKYIIDADLNDDILGFKYCLQDKEIASIMYDAIINIPTKNEYHFRVHTKGVGIFCNMKQGIKKDSLVVEYFGEIYRPWHWFEKQDVIKQGQNANKLPKDLPEFYNILFERHLDDPNGYNILTVDPILHGNYSSRLSHSCVANCQTVNKVRNGYYSIGMFTNKDISFGEELCFDYCSFTESEKEYEEAICLCGTEYCKGRFLNLANDKKNLSIMKNNHTFIDRNYLLFKAVTNPVLTEEDIYRLHNNGLRSSSLEVAPNWLQKWASLICEYLEFEEILYPTFYKDDFPECYKLDDIKVEARMQKETQIQNIAITIDKIMHVLESMGTELPPIRPLNFEERYKRLWEEPGCLKENVMSVLDKIEKCAQVDQSKQMLQNSNSTITLSLTEDMQVVEPPSSDNEDLYKQKYFKVRKVLGDISEILRSVNSFNVAVPAFCDILMMYSATETYFTQTEVYKKSKSDEVIIRKCDVRHGEGASMDKYSQGKQAYKGCKEYDSQYIWGQLVVWYKQTVDKPNASLSADRRGTLSIPDVQSFIVNASKAQFVSNQNESVQKGKKGGRGKKNNRESAEEILPSAGSRSRPRTTTNANQSDQLMQSEQESPEIPAPQEASMKLHENTRTLKIVYPSKRLQNRKDFLGHWRETFSKQWDVCCQWSFQNKKKMYGSIQFESVLRADMKLREAFRNIQSEDISQEEKQQKYHERYQAFMKSRLEYFDDVVNQLLTY